MEEQSQSSSSGSPDVVETPRPDTTPPNVEPEVKDDDQPKYDGGPIPRPDNDLDAPTD